jgi:hypothetical protein
MSDDLIDAVIGFVLDMVDTAQGVMDMAGAFGRKKRSVLSQALRI